MGHRNFHQQRRRCWSQSQTVQPGALMKITVELWTVIHRWTSHPGLLARRLPFRTDAVKSQQSLFDGLRWESTQSQLIRWKTSGSLALFLLKQVSVSVNEPGGLVHVDDMQKMQGWHQHTGSGCGRMLHSGLLWEDVTQLANLHYTSFTSDSWILCKSITRPWQGFEYYLHSYLHILTENWGVNNYKILAGTHHARLIVPT